MWNLKYDTNDFFFTKQKQTHRQKRQDYQRETGGGGINQEFGKQYKPLYIRDKQQGSTVYLGHYIQYPVVEKI